jgi:Protein of unknown function (DUF1569)
MLRTLEDRSARDSIAARIRAVTAASPRQWGKMSPHQMICHLTDSYVAMIGEKAVSPVNIPLPKPLLRWIVLRAPWKWPHNAKTRPEVAQDAGGTPPVDFESDRAQLLGSIDRFCAAPDSARTPHPMFGSLSREEWMIWGYLHADHHLRQFGL